PPFAGVATSTSVDPAAPHPGGESDEQEAIRAVNPDGVTDPRVTSPNAAGTTTCTLPIELLLDAAFPMSTVKAVRSPTWVLPGVTVGEKSPFLAAANAP